MKRSLHLVIVLCCFFTLSARCQLAITEVLSSGSTNLGPTQVTQNSDYWELTNFGTNEVNLTGYKFDDADNNLAAADSAPFEGLVIGPGESILFAQNNVNTNELSIREWWGSNLPPALKIVFYSGNGLSSAGDGIRLWNPSATVASDTVDRVDFGEATRGVAFTYDPMTGEFGTLSTNNAGGAFKAEKTDDVGSPGKTTGPTPLKVTRQPVSAVFNQGDTAEFSVALSGRPRGRVQWFFKGNPIDGANGTTLQITNVQSSSTGFYQARIDNGVTNVASVAAELALQSQGSSPIITQAPSDFTFTAGQSHTFRAVATGVPQPGFEWRRGDQLIEGENTGELTLAGALETDSGLYQVIARNALGAATNSFRVTVTAPPRLTVTEVMSSSSTNVAGHGDWWELTNLGDVGIPLNGYRFDDNSETLAAAFTITNNVVIAPGESVIFVESMTPDAFKEWWGPGNLPAGLQVITYKGNGLSSLGDAVNLWNAAATEDSDKVASAVFSTATSGISFGYDPTSGQFGGLSADGINGGFTSASGGDVGSPGYIRKSLTARQPRITAITKSSGAVRLVWTSEAGKNYEAQARDGFDPASGWTAVTTVTAIGLSTEVELFPSDATQRFYRIRAVE